MTPRLHVLVLLATFAAAACDPVNDNAVDALGGEASGVGKGPLHRPGQPCLLCHDGALGNPPRFTVAGTIFQTDSSRTPASDATVKLTDKNGATTALVTNEAGNFYASPGDFDPVFPLSVVVSFQGTEQKMSSLINGDGSCATCHVDPAGQSAVGHVFATGPAP
jgi:hypothetical protein